MKAIKILLSLSLAGMIFLTSCKSDDDGPQQGIIVENCDDTGCNDKNCATELDVNRKLVECFLDADNDVDWYQFTVTDADVSTGPLTYDFTFFNKTENMSIAVELFLNGITGGSVLTSGNGDGIYEPMLDLTGAVTFLEAGTYYIKVNRDSGDRGVGAYKFYFN